MSVVTPGPEGHRFVRGDYGKEYAFEIVELIEERNCANGCQRADPADKDAPGGCCAILIRILCEEPVPEIDPRPDGPVCTVREPIGGEG